MNTLFTILITLIALSGFPIGLLIARLTKEELQQGKKWFSLIIFACIIAIIISVIKTEKETFLFLVASFTFILLIALASLVKARKLEKKPKSKKKRKIKK